MTLAGLWALVLLAAAAKLSPPLGLDAYMPIPEDNPPTPKKVALGRKLFSDRQLSRDRSMHMAWYEQRDASSWRLRVSDAFECTAGEIAPAATRAVYCNRRIAQRRRMSLVTIAIIYFCRTCGKVLTVLPDQPVVCCGTSIIPLWAQQNRIKAPAETNE